MLLLNNFFCFSLENTFLFHFHCMLYLINNLLCFFFIFLILGYSLFKTWSHSFLWLNGSLFFFLLLGLSTLFFIFFNEFFRIFAYESLIVSIVLLVFFRLSWGPWNRFASILFQWYLINNLSNLGIAELAIFQNFSISSGVYWCLLLFFLFFFDFSFLFLFVALCILV